MKYKMPLQVFAITSLTGARYGIALFVCFEEADESFDSKNDFEWSSFHSDEYYVNKLKGNRDTYSFFTIKKYSFCCNNTLMFFFFFISNV